MRPVRPAATVATALRRTARAALSLALAAALGCASVGTPVPEPARETGKLFFWEVSSAGGATAHLMGSVHVASRSLEIDPRVSAALDAADTLVMEVDPAEMDPNALVGMVLDKGRLPADQRLADLIAPETHAALQEALRERGLDPEPMEIFAPWVSMYMLLGTMLGEQGLEAELGVEAQVSERASPDLPVIGLETAEFQIDLFARLPLETQELLLADLLENPPDAEGELGLLFDAWQKGDDARMAEIGLGLDDDPAAEVFYRAIYVERNHSMAEGIAGLLQEGRSRRLFVVIGALHMVGEEGIPSLLAERGFAVRRLDKTP